MDIIGQNNTTPHDHHHSPWRSPSEVQRVGIGFLKMTHVLLGIYVYDWFLSLDFEWGFVAGKPHRNFKWPMIFYFANRYCMLGALIGAIIALDTETKVDCKALYIFIQLTGAAAVGLASINLSVRTITIWSSNKFIVGGLILAILGQWAIILQGGRLTATWRNQTGLGCTIKKETDGKILSAIFIYAMCFDLIVLLLTSYKLFVLNSKKISGQSRLTQVIFVDGLIFFIVAFLVNLTAAIFIMLDLNALMSMMFTLPAAVFSTMVACRAVRRLKNTRKILDAERIAANEMGYPVGLVHECEHDEKPSIHIKIETNIHHDIEYQPQSSERSLTIGESDIGLGMVIAGPRVETEN